MSRALDYVNYEKLKQNNAEPVTDENQKSQIITLQESCCEALSNSVYRVGNVGLVLEAVGQLPRHVLLLLLRVAIERSHNATVSQIISAWPFHTLCLREVIDPHSHQDLFQEGMNLDIVLFRGLIHRRKTCKMTCLDLRGWKLNREFSMLIVQLWPLLSLPKRTLQNIKSLAQTATRQAALTVKSLNSQQAATEFAAVLETRISSVLARCRDLRINIPRGHELIVKLDSLSFFVGDKMSQDYFITNCLRHITPLKLQLSQIFFRTSLSARLDNDFLVSPSAVINSHDTQYVDGVSLRSMGEMYFKMFVSCLTRFHNVQAVELQDCNIYLQKGRTRSKTEDRNILCNFLSSFPQLCRLDLGYNYLLGCLGEVLEAVTAPLHYLGLRGCDLDLDDLEALAASKHAPEILELNLSKVIISTGREFVLGEVSVSPPALVGILRSFPKLTVLNLSQNTFSDGQIEELCNVLRSHVRNLKVLDIAAVVMTTKQQLEVCLACAAIPTFQKIVITLVTSLVDELQSGADDIANHIKEKLARAGRSDIRLQTLLFSRAIFADIVVDDWAL